MNAHRHSVTFPIIEDEIHKEKFSKKHVLPMFFKDKWQSENLTYFGMEMNELDTLKWVSIRHKREHYSIVKTG